MNVDVDKDMDETNFEVIVIGAGITGIIAASRYLQVHQDCKLTILEKDYCLGGLWSQRRSYENFWTQFPPGMVRYSDMTMEEPPESDCKPSCYKAKYLTRYLEQYVDRIRRGNRSLRDRIRFGTEVESIEKRGGRWRISCKNAAKESLTFSAEKLMMAAGQYSQPKVPNFPGRENFHGPIFHSEDFGRCGISSDDSVKHVVVIGAGKSSADMIYELLQSGKKEVTWIIRKSGLGPGFFAPIDTKTPYKNGFEMAMTRVIETFQPALLCPDGWWAWFLHRTWIGLSLVKKLFAFVDQDTRARADYRGRKSTKGFEKLEFDTAIFWQNGTGGVLHHADFWPLVAENVTIHRSDNFRLGDRRMHLDDGTSIPCDAILCGTGFNHSVRFFKPDLLVQLDLPHKVEDEPAEMTAKWEKLILEADDMVLKRFPLLADPPPHYQRPADTTPYRLYHELAPLKDDSILFLCAVIPGNMFLVAEAQAIWAVAYFDKKIALPSIEEREWDTAKWVAWQRRRFLSNGNLAVFVPFESIAYTDTLLNELGLTAHRKGWWRDLVDPVSADDIGKAWKQYLQKYGI